MLAANQLYQADVERTARSVEPLFGLLAGQSVFVTGATGLIGSAFVDLLLAANRLFGTGVKVYAAARSPEGLARRFGEPAGLVAVQYDATRANEFPERADYIVHAASNASPERYVNQPVETMLANFCGLHGLLLWASSVKARRVLYVSSSEVYGERRQAQSR